MSWSQNKMNFFTLIRSNILFRPVRNGAFIFCFALISASLFSGNYILASASDNAESGISRLGADIIVVPQDYQPKNEPVILRTGSSTSFINQSITSTLQGIPDISRISPQIYLGTVNLTPENPVDIIAFDEKSDFTVHPWIPKKNSASLKPDEIYAGDEIPREEGSILTLYGHPFTIAGRLDPTGTTVDSSVFIRIEDARILEKNTALQNLSRTPVPEDKVTALLVRVNDANRAQNISYQIVQEIWGVRVQTPEVLISTVSSHLNSLTRILTLAAVVASLLSLPLIALISMMAANERLREIGVFRALGATKKIIFALILGESIVIALIGGVIGVVFSFGILTVFSDQIGKISQVPLSLPSIGTITAIMSLALILTISIGGLASFYPAYRSATMEPYTAIRSGEV